MCAAATFENRALYVHIPDVYKRQTLERFLLLIALGVPMIRLIRSLRQYSLALDHFKQRLAEENEDSSTTGKC